MFRNIYKNGNFNHFCYKTLQNEQKKRNNDVKKTSNKANKKFSKKKTIDTIIDNEVKLELAEVAPAVKQTKKVITKKDGQERKSLK